ncbi:MAG: phage holin family protein [Verrucomicrobia bacterium]|nr:phage holin family protein [Verrucomicrobiota bacterium]
MNAQNSNAQRAKGSDHLKSWASIFLDYFDAKARLVAAESTEARSHFVGLLILSGIMLVLSLSSALMYAVCLLYLVATLFRLAWGWSALICGALLTLAALLFFVLLRAQLRKPVFQLSLKDLEKDREWISQAKTKAP